MNGPNLDFMGRFYLRPDVVIYSEWPIEYYGGGERLMIMLLGAFRSLGFKTQIIDNSRMRVPSRINRESLIEKYGENIKSSIMRKYGVFKPIEQYFPDPNEIKNGQNSVSLIFLRRFPSNKYIDKLTANHVNLIFCIHGITFERFRITNPLIIAHQIIMRIKAHFFAIKIRGNIRVQTLLPDTSKLLIRNGADPSKVFLIENGFDKLSHLPIRNDREFSIVFVGRLENLQKGIGRLRKTIEKLQFESPKLCFKIIGSGKSSNLLKKLPKNTNWYKNIGDEEKIEIMNNSNLMIITSNIEPYPRVAIEGLFSGLPLVTTPTSGPEHIISKDADFGMVSSFSVNDIASHIMEYFKTWTNDKREYFELRKRIETRSKEIFDVNKMLTNYGKMVLNAIIEPESKESSDC